MNRFAISILAVILLGTSSALAAEPTKDECIAANESAQDLRQAGKLREARHLLGRSFSVRSTLAPGRGYGTRYTVPTMNLAAYNGLLPRYGVYVTELTVRNPSQAAIVFESVTNIGVRPTFGQDSFAVESHILNFTPLDVSEATELVVTFHLRLRDEHKFPDAAALKAQIQADVKRAQRWFRLRVSLSS